MFRQLTNRVAYAPARVAFFSSTSKKNSRKLDLPAAPTGSEPLKESDFPQYLAPLYSNGWGMSVTQIRPKENPHLSVSMLKRTFGFGSRQQLSEFIKKTPTFASNETAPDAIVARNKNALWVAVTSAAGVTRAQLRVAIETEKEYQNLLGNELDIKQMEEKWQIVSLERLQSLAADFVPKIIKAATPTLIKASRVSLPAPPPAPAYPAALISDEEISTYLAPLSTHGWHVTTMAAGDKRLRGNPFLHRVYTFKDSVSAWSFLPTALEAVPIIPESIAGGEVKLSMTSDGGVEMKVGLISGLAVGAPKKYGVTLGDLRTAMELENLYVAKFSEHAKPEIHYSRTPENQAEMWNFKSLR